MEAVIVIDVLRRAGIDVTSAGLSDGPITASRGVTLLPDLLWSEINPTDFDMLILPGGLGGTHALCEHAGVQRALKEFDARKKPIGALCAAPLALHTAGILQNRRFTCYPGVEEEMNGAIMRSDERVVEDGNLITSQGPGSAFEFALKIAERLTDTATARRAAEGMLL
jgi:4-methyl-5(b-hydroxyethyl)-thiazole monophosphate biosynthesis